MKEKWDRRVWMCGAGNLVCSLVISYHFHVDKTTWVGLWLEPLSMSMWSLSELERKKNVQSKEMDFVAKEKKKLKKKSEYWKPAGSKRLFNHSHTYPTSHQIALDGSSGSAFSPYLGPGLKMDLLSYLFTLPFKLQKSLQTFVLLAKYLLHECHIHLRIYLKCWRNCTTCLHYLLGITWFWSLIKIIFN